MHSTGTAQGGEMHLLKTAEDPIHTCWARTQAMEELAKLQTLLLKLYDIRVR